MGSGYLKANTQAVLFAIFAGAVIAAGAILASAIWV